ncbi:Cupin 2 conserved barrel domain protein [Metallosphaera cuprina Ar-4]|uniref:Cupin 2 conserved barrel domain protein n=1 Tax=Metallosphaera cuprina (strain Ar-4) TaxID=1006006 RepID=F4G2Y0_METCR|nr:Cupin 2 conserved barrel domain protein [Metallosphaera cuprina Ar-4]
MRGVEPSKRHTLALSEFDELRDGEELTVIADHYPAQLTQSIRKNKET